MCVICPPQYMSHVRIYCWACSLLWLVMTSMRKMSLKMHSHRKNSTHISKRDDEENRQKEIEERKAKFELRQSENERLADMLVNAQRDAQRTNKKKGKLMRKQEQILRANDLDEMGLDNVDDESDEEVKALQKLKELNGQHNEANIPSHCDEKDDESSKSYSSDDEWNQDLLDRAILQRHEDIKVCLPFGETLCVVSKRENESSNENDDLKREVYFYQQAMEAVRNGRKELEAENVPHFRPTDYFAEMLKNDEHMARIKQNLLFEKKKK